MAVAILQILTSTLPSPHKDEWEENQLPGVLLAELLLICKRWEASGKRLVVGGVAVSSNLATRDAVFDFCFLYIDWLTSFNSEVLSGLCESVRIFSVKAFTVQVEKYFTRSIFMSDRQ